jgi:hypothetical protein
MHEWRAICVEDFSRNHRRSVKSLMVCLDIAGHAVRVRTSTMRNVPLDLAKSVAAVFALAGFAVACVSGLLWEMSATAAMWRGLVAMAVCFAVGSIAGAVLERVVREHNKSYEANKPLPQLLRPASQSTTGGGGGGARAMGGDGELDGQEDDAKNM